VSQVISVAAQSGCCSCRLWLDPRQVFASF